MRKNVFITTTFLAGSLLLAQTGKKLPINPSSIKVEKTSNSELFIQEQSNPTISTHPLFSAQNKKNNKSKYPQIASVSATRFAGSMNIFGVLTSTQKPLQYNSDLDIVTFVHRKSVTYASAPVSNSGSILFTWSLNKGNTWDSSCVWADGTNLGRYPQGGVYNPSGNTNINNAYFVATGPVTQGSGWVGGFFASKSYTAAVGGNNTALNAPNTQFIPTVYQNNNHAFVRNFFTATNDGIVRAAGTIYDDYPNLLTSSGPSSPRGMAIMRGNFNAGSFTWTLDSLIFPVTTASDGSKNLFSTPYMAWNNSGTVGYAIMLGQRQGLTNDTMKGLQPIVYKTTNSGASWTLIPPFNFVNLSNVDNRLLSATSGKNYAVPFFWFNEGIDVTVDVNDNLHLVGTVVSAYSIHPDSVFYTYTINSGGGCGSQNYNFYYGSTQFMPTIMDFVLNSSNNKWNGILVDSMGTEGTRGGSNSCSQWNANSISVNARIQVSRNDVGDKIFYSWTETDTSVTGHHFNVYPDLYMKGYDVNTNMITNKTMVIGTSVSTPTEAATGISFHYMSNKAINIGSGTYEIPFTFSYDPSFGGNGPVNVGHFYIKGAQFSLSDFTTNATPLSANSSNSAMNVTKISNAVNVYPNPVKDNTNLSFNLNNASDVRIEIMNTLGQVINSMNISAKAGINVVNVDLSNENAGVYFFNVITNTGKMTGKIIKQ